MRKRTKNDWESPQKYWEIPLKYLNKIKGKRIFNSGKSIKKKEETPQNLNLEEFPKNMKKLQKCLKKKRFMRGFRVFLICFPVEAFPCHPSHNILLPSEHSEVFLETLEHLLSNLAGVKKKFTS